jgi:hypothetical protein
MRASQSVAFGQLSGITRNGIDHSVSSLPWITCDRNQIAGNNDKFVSEQCDISFEQPDMSG